MSEQIGASEHAINLNEVLTLQDVTVREGTVLRPMQNSDATGVLQILEADPSIRKRVTVASRMHNEEDVKREVAAYQNEGDHIRYIIHENGTCVGLVSLWRDSGFFGQEAKPHAYGFGYFLDPTARGRGLITDSIRTLMNVSQACLRIDTFMAFCEDDNTESIAVLKKLGFMPTENTFSEPAAGWTERLYEKEATNA